MRLKPVALALATSLVAVMGAAREEPAADERGTATGSGPSELVSFDADAQTITIKKPTAEVPAPDPETLKVEGKALASLKEYRAGDKIVLTCKDGTGDVPAAATGASKPEAASETAGTEASKPEAKAGGKTAPCLVVEIAKAPEKD